MSNNLFPSLTLNLGTLRKKLAPDGHDAFTVFSQHVFAEAQEIMEAVWVAAEMRVGGAYAHAILALDAIEEVKRRQEQQP